MTVPEKKVVSELSFEVVPEVFDVAMGPIRVPIPITLDNLVAGAFCDLASLNGRCVFIALDAAHHLHAEGAVAELGQIARAVGVEALFHLVEAISFVRRAVKNRVCCEILV